MIERERNGKYVGACNWLVEYANPALSDPDWYPDFPSDMTVIQDCGARMFGTDWGWYCDNGHEWVQAEIRDQEGWDYDD
jgi:hypothetical protein